MRHRRAGALERAAVAFIVRHAAGAVLVARLAALVNATNRRGIARGIRRAVKGGAVGHQGVGESRPPVVGQRREDGAHANGGYNVIRTLAKADDAGAVALAEEIEGVDSHGRATTSIGIKDSLVSGDRGLIAGQDDPLQRRLGAAVVV